MKEVVETSTFAVGPSVAIRYTNSAWIPDLKMTSKAGVMTLLGNVTGKRVEKDLTGSFTPIDVSESDQSIVLVGNLEVNLDYKITSNLTAGIGFSVMYLPGIEKVPPIDISYDEFNQSYYPGQDVALAGLTANIAYGF
jgi:hypothetical protein